MAFQLHEGQLVELGWVRGTCPDGQHTIPNAEAYALQQLLQHTTAETLTCVVDSTMCIKRFQKLERTRMARLQRMSNAETWVQIRESSKGRSIKLGWCKSNLTEDQFRARFPEEDVSMHQANARADALAIEFIAMVERQHVVATARDVNRWLDTLKERANFLLAQEEKLGPFKMFWPCKTQQEAAATCLALP